MRAVQRGVAVERVVNAPLALDLARWHIRHSGLRLVRQPGYIVVLLVLTAIELLVRGAVVALLVAAAWVGGAVLITRLLGGCAERPLEANQRLLGDE